MMAPMRCSDCPRFDSEKSLCKDGKVNPPSWPMAVEVAKVMGVRSICTFNDHREKLVATRTLSKGKVRIKQQIEPKEQ